MESIRAGTARDPVVLFRAREDSVTEEEAQQERTILGKIAHFVAVLFTEVTRGVTYVLFYALAFSSYARSSDFLNDLMGVNIAAANAHRSIFPHIQFDKIAAAYGFPIDPVVFEIDGAVSVQLRLTADTNTLNNLPGTVSGSTNYWAGLGTSLVGVKGAAGYAKFCANAVNTTYTLSAASTVVQAKSNLPGQEVFAWSGYANAPSTVKAVTRVVNLNAIPDGTGNCTYSMKMLAQEAFELWEPGMATFNVYELNLVADKNGKWIFLPAEGQFNWFFYRKARTDIIAMAAVSQVWSLALMAAGVLWRTREGTTDRLSVYIDLDAMACRYYNSLIVNAIEVYIVFVDRYVIFRTVNAIDFFLTGGWGFDSFSMITQFINIMGGFFFVILAVHKVIALVTYAFAFAIKVSLDARHQHQQHLHGSTATNVNHDRSPNSWLALVKETFRPNPELILVAVVVAPKYFYAGFFGGATKWGPITMANVSAMGSCLGANLLMWNLLCCAMTITPIGIVYVICDYGKSLENSWVRHRLPGRCYSGYRDLVSKKSGKIIMKEYSENRLISIVEGLLSLFYTVVMEKRNPAKTELLYNVRIQELVQDSVFSEVECVRACLFIETIEKRLAHETDDNLKRKHNHKCTVASSDTSNLILRWKDGQYIHRDNLRELCYKKMQLGPSVPILNELDQTIKADKDGKD
ncbi:hypothetical protein HDU99_001033, partial [Rhizoclosmatium hyalinum]